MPRDTRPFITVHDGMPEHPKIEGLSDAGFRLLVSTWCWCSRNRTDGKVREASWAKRGTRKARQELIDAGLVEPASDGVLMHDYLDHQRSAEEIDELSRKRAEAGSKGGKAKANAVAKAKQVLPPEVSRTGNDGDSSTSSDREDTATPRPLQANESGKTPLAIAKQTASKSVADTDTDTEEEQKSLSNAQKSFDEFWSIYPRRTGRRGALAEFTRAVRRASVDEILAGAKRYRDDPNRADEFTKHPSTWLHQDCWTDDPLPSRVRQEQRRVPEW